jgi:phosphohistidine phosphatase
MELYVFRHAKAHPARGRRSDAERRLTRGGKRKLERRARSLEAGGLELERLLHSPWTRAEESARVLERLSARPRETCALLCAPPGLELLGLLASLRAARVGLVGHEPWLAQLVGWLVVGHPHAPTWLALKKGGCALLSGEPVPGGMQLHALLPARALER